VSDDPTDSTRVFCTSLEDGGVYVPFKMDDTTVYFETRVPTQYKLENCKVIPLTDETVWEPSSVNIASVTVTLGLPIIEMSERRKISVMSVKNNNVIPPPEESSHVNRMIGNVRMATAFGEASILFLGSIDRHSRV
jgi:hypothetical protein